jgi:hypothetical protein
MSQYISVHKLPHPIEDQRVADYNRRTICEVRGYCGPFINLAYYSQYPDPAWHGAGECIVCCNTCIVALEEEKQRIVSAGYPRVENGGESPGTGVVAA